MSDPVPPTYTFTTNYTQGTRTASGSFNPTPPTGVNGKPLIKVGDTVKFLFVGTPSNTSDTATVSASAFIAICKGILINGQTDPVGTAKTVTPIDGATLTMGADSVGYWGFAISFTANFTNAAGEVQGTEFFYLPDPEVDIETGSGRSLPLSN